MLSKKDTNACAISVFIWDFLSEMTFALVLFIISSYLMFFLIQFYFAVYFLIQFYFAAFLKPQIYITYRALNDLAR